MGVIFAGQIKPVMPDKYYVSVSKLSISTSKDDFPMLANNTTSCKQLGVNKTISAYWQTLTGWPVGITSIPRWPHSSPARSMATQLDTNFYF